MNDPVVLRKLESLERCVRSIEAARPSSLDKLQSDWLVQDALVMNLARAVQLAVDAASRICATHGLGRVSKMAESFARLEVAGLLDSELATQMKRSVGFRNVAIHNYTEINQQVLFDVSFSAPAQLRAFTRAVIAIESH